MPCPSPPDARASSTLPPLVATELDNWRAGGIQVQVFPATREEIALSIGLSIRAGADQAAIWANGDRLLPDAGSIRRVPDDVLRHP